MARYHSQTLTLSQEPRPARSLLCAKSVWQGFCNECLASLPFQVHEHMMRIQWGWNSGLLFPCIPINPGGHSKHSISSQIWNSDGIKIWHLYYMQGFPYQEYKFTCKCNKSKCMCTGDSEDGSYVLLYFTGMYKDGHLKTLTISLDCSVTSLDPLITMLPALAFIWMEPDAYICNDVLNASILKIKKSHYILNVDGFKSRQIIQFSCNWQKNLFI